MRKIFLDIGAYDGNDSKWFLENNPEGKVFAFECDKRNVEAIKKRGLDIRLIEAAAWIYDGEVEYYYGNPDGGTLLSCKKTGGINPFNYYSVPCIDFAKFMKDNFIKADHITIKMNCEGSEYQLINHIKRTNLIEWVDKWYVDWHYHKIGMKESEHNDIAKLIKNNRWPLWK